MRLPILLASLLLALPGARADLAAIREDLAREKIRRVEEYLRTTPAPPDELAAVNLLLDARQELRHVPEMIPLLQRRYALMLADPQSNLQHLLERTAVPLAQALAATRRRAEAVEFLGRVKADLARHPSSAQINTALDALINQLRPPREGDTPDFTFTEAGGARTVKAADYRGKVTQLEFWVTNCDICRAQKDTLQIAWRKHHDRGFEVVGFGQDEKREVMDAFLKEQGLPWVNCWDADPAHRFALKLNIDFIPTSLLLDADGRVIALNLRGDALLAKLDELFPAK